MLQSTRTSDTRRKRLDTIETATAFHEAFDTSIACLSNDCAEANLARPPILLTIVCYSSWQHKTEAQDILVASSLNSLYIRFNCQTLRKQG